MLYSLQAKTSLNRFTYLKFSSLDLIFATPLTAIIFCSPSQISLFHISDNFNPYSAFKPSRNNIMKQTTSTNFEQYWRLVEYCAHVHQTRSPRGHQGAFTCVYPALCLATHSITRADARRLLPALITNTTHSNTIRDCEFEYVQSWLYRDLDVILRFTLI